MLKNTRISGLKFCFICFSAEHVHRTRRCPVAIFVKICCRDEKDVEILPGNILSEGKKMRTSSEIVLQFWSHSRYINYSLQRLGNASVYSPFVPYQALPGKRRSLVSRSTFKMAATFDREILYPLYASRLAKETA